LYFTRRPLAVYTVVMPDPSSLPVTFTDIESAADRIAGVANRTPVITSRTFNELTGREMFFKCENFQRVGAFKFRGAYNAMSRLGDEQKRRGVLTYSSGNHAQAIALAGRLLGVPTTIVMPNDAPRVKLLATQGYGAEVVQHERSETKREQVGRELCESRGLTLVSPFDHPHVIAGQGTAARELLSEVGELDALIVPVGGGGLISGSSIATKAMAPSCRVIGAEPEGGDDACQSFRAKSVVTVEHPETIADGAMTPCIGEVNLQIMLACVDQMIPIPDAALVRAMRFFAERMKIIVEPTGCLAAAAVMDGLASSPGDRVGVIISGGNIDMARFASLLDAG